MTALLIDVDKIYNPRLKIPNLALMQISSYHKSNGKEVKIVKDPKTSFEFERSWDHVYISCIFEKNRVHAETIADTFIESGHGISPGSNITCGGTGFGFDHDWLPEHMQKVKPDYDLYKSEYSQGFTTRGCVRTCDFCVVPKKEGHIRIWQHPSEFHDDRFNSCMIMDNNLFGSPQKWQDDVFRWFYENGVTMISPQGWDARLLTEWRARLLASIRHKDGQLHFAWDDYYGEADVVDAIKLLGEYGFNLRRNISFYVLCGYNTSFEQDLYRCKRLKELGVRAYAMRYRQTPQLNALARWTALPKLFWKIDFEDYTRNRKDYQGGS